MARSKPDWITSRVPRIPVELACSEWRCPLWLEVPRFFHRDSSLSAFVCLQTEGCQFNKFQPSQLLAPLRCQSQHLEPGSRFAAQGMPPEYQFNETTTLRLDKGWNCLRLLALGIESRKHLKNNQIKNQKLFFEKTLALTKSRRHLRGLLDSTDGILPWSLLDSGRHNSSMNLSRVPYRLAFASETFAADSLASPKGVCWMPGTSLLITEYP